MGSSSSSCRDVDMSEDSPVSTAEEARRRWLPATRPQLLRRDFRPSDPDKDPEEFSVMQWNVLAYGLSAQNDKDGTNQVIFSPAIVHSPRIKHTKWKYFYHDRGGKSDNLVCSKVRINFHRIHCISIFVYLSTFQKQSQTAC